jgi:hypothetical protein
MMCLELASTFLKASMSAEGMAVDKSWDPHEKGLRRCGLTVGMNLI